MKAMHVMTRLVVTATPKMSVNDAAELLTEYHISGLPVVDAEGRVVGIFSSTDALGKRGEFVSEVMTCPAITVEPETCVEELATLLAAKNINRLPVVQGGRLVGIVCRADLVRYLATRRAWAEAREDS